VKECDETRWMRPLLNKVHASESKEKLLELRNEFKGQHAQKVILIRYIERKWMNGESMPTWNYQHVDTNNLVESWHKTPKKVHLGNERNVCADYLIFLLYNIIKTDFRVTYLKTRKGLLPVELSAYDKMKKAKAMNLELSLAKDMITEKMDEFKDPLYLYLVKRIYNVFEINYDSMLSPKPAHHTTDNMEIGRNLNDFSAISFFKFLNFPSDRRQVASKVWFEVIALVGEQCPKKAKGLRHQWSTTKEKRKSYWSNKEDMEKKVVKHLAALEDYARHQILVAARKVDVDTEILVHNFIAGWDVELPILNESYSEEIGSKNKEMLFKIALKNLHDVQRMNRIPSFDKGRCLQYKDAFVALSGIWNLFSQNASDHFDPAQSKEAQDLCLLPHLDAKIPGIDLIVQPLIDKLNDGSSLQELLEHTYKLQYELPAQRLNLRVLQTMPLTGPKALSEADALLLWASVFKDGLPLDTALSLHLGDQGCAATTLSKSALAEAFDTDNATRKCDCILAVDGLEVGNFEAKRESSSSIDIAIQMRKNAKINKSILLELEKYGLECPPILNIQGMV
ncbi:hypothetical protein BGZ54_001477, partial [Gamsiella multidivaricata]